MVFSVSLLNARYIVTSLFSSNSLMANHKVIYLVCCLELLFVESHRDGFLETLRLRHCWFEHC